MAPHVQDHVVDDVGRNGRAHPHPADRHVFQTMEQIGKRSNDSEWKQRLASIVIAIVICAALYGALYLSLRLHD